VVKIEWERACAPQGSWRRPPQGQL
jgi:hypothetical protein